MGEASRTIYMLYLQLKAIDVLLLIILLILYYRNKKLPFEKTRFFELALIFIVINVLCDDASAYGLYHFEGTRGVLGRLWHKASTLAMCVSMYFFHMHVRSMGGKYRKDDTAKNIISLLPMAVAAGGFIGAPASVHIGEDGRYFFGTADNIAYIVMGAYFFMDIYYMIAGRVKITRKKMANLAVGLCIFAVFEAVQIAYPAVLLSSTGLIFLMLMGYFNFEDSKAYINYENGCLNNMAYRRALNKYFSEGKKFYVVQASFNEFQMIHGKYGHDVCQQIVKNIVDIVERELGSTAYAIEEEMVGSIVDSEKYTPQKMTDMVNAIEFDYETNESSIHITGAAFLVRCPEEAESAAELENIFAFMRSHKSSAEKFHEYDKDIFGERQRYSDIVRILEKAIANDGFYMVYQPIYSVKDDTFHSAEALIRLKDDRSLGFISPEEFIPIAEKEGLIMKIGEIVLTKVCEFSKRANLIGNGIKYLEVNLSAIQCIDQGLSNQIKNTIIKYDLPWNFLNLEITETVAVSSGNMLNRNVEIIRNMGASFSMDDFGTGYSNLAQMADVQYEIIKLDKSLIWHCYPEQRKKLMQDESPKQREKSILKSIAVLTKVIELINDLNLKIVAEGVETKEMVADLSAKGVDYLQGYYFSKPLREEEFVKFLNSV